MEIAANLFFSPTGSNTNQAKNTEVRVQNSIRSELCVVVVCVRMVILEGAL